MASHDDASLPRRVWWLTVLLFVGVSALAWPVVYFIAITMVPNRTSEGYLVMPIGQALVAFVLAPVVGLMASWRFGLSSATPRG